MYGMSGVGEVQITVIDNATNISVPLPNLQAVIGCASGGTAAVATVVATASAQTLQSNFGYGQLPEYAALAVLNGATVLALRASTVTTGTASGVWTPLTNTGTSALTVTLDGTTGAFDDYYVIAKVVTGGTRGTAGVQFQVSLDAGRNYGPVINLGIATSYVIPNTGVTLNFGAGTFVAGDLYEFSTTGPQTNTAGVQSCLNALLASAYALTGWGSMHILGSWNGAQATTIETYLDTFATNYVFTRAMVSNRDTSPASKWGGSAETESAWMTQVQNDTQALSAKRIDMAAGHYNTPSAYANAAAGAPAYRRPGQWSAAVRQTQIPPQRHQGRVRDGSLAQIVVNPSSDPSDGFVYHDERVNPGLDASRFTSFCTRKGRPGFFVVNPNLMSPLGSDFTLLPLGNVMDVACDIVHTKGLDFVNADIRLNANGTIYENEARYIESQIQSALIIAMLSQSMISGATVVVNRSTNVSALKQVNFDVTINARGYILKEVVTIGFNNPLTAQ